MWSIRSNCPTTVHSRTVGGWMIPVANAYQRVDSLEWSKPELTHANESRSEALLKTTRCNCSALRRLPTARTTQLAG
jgi:hypothetical protein